MQRTTARSGTKLVIILALGITAAACGQSAVESVAGSTTPPPQPAATGSGAGGGDAQVPDQATSPPGTGSTTNPVPPATFGGLTSVAIETNAEFPVMVNAPPGDDNIFVVGKEGTVWKQPRDGGPETLVLDIRSAVTTGNEQGLLGLAFHPDFNQTHRAFVSYTDVRGGSVLAEFEVGDDGIFSAESTLLALHQPAPNHNGGMVEFGPDGYLYFGLGDGGGANDRFGNGQDPSTLLGTLLRLDVSEVGHLSAPPDNPFGSDEGAPEVWAYGLRNPWRFTFDGNSLYVADVGQGGFEEIDVVDAGQPGLNYGWPIMEGSHCFSPATECASGELVLPTVEIPHGDGGTCSITGGYVYRGRDIPEIDGQYFYSDYCGGYLRSVTVADGEVVEHLDWTEQVGDLGQVTSFGRDGHGELYVTSADGAVRRLVAIR